MRTKGGRELKEYLAALGAQVREARAKRGMARHILARASGVSERYLAQLESGAANPSVAVLRQIAQAVSYPLSHLVAGPHGEPPELSEIKRVLDATSGAKLPGILASLRLLLSADSEADKGQRISLIGLRGAGKSTLGRLLAERLRSPFIKLDRLVEQEYGAGIGEILALGGQNAFRRHEYRALEGAICSYRKAVIATGGGIVSEVATFSLLLERTHTIWLSAPPEEYMSRVIAQGDLRPMARIDEAMEDLRAILRARERYYRMAHAKLDTTGLTVAESAEALHAAALRLLAAGSTGREGASGSTETLRRSEHAL
jgi:XRE family transcriptional regulator, aerobic/anaerobic benzoate catabolism transcriptional regulator